MRPSASEPTRHDATGRNATTAPAAGEVLVRPRTIAVSQIDVEISQGLFGDGAVLGRSFVGVVQEVGTGKDKAWRSRRVVCSPTIACGQCDLCRSGLPEHCRNACAVGALSGDGKSIQSIALPLGSVLAVPDHVDDDRAAFATLVASAMQVSRQLRIEGKPYITVLGDGPLGLITAQIMSQRNASVRVLGRFTEKLEHCTKWGIKHRHVDDVGRRADQDVVIDCTGTPSGLELSMQLVRPRGTIVLKSLASLQTQIGRAAGAMIDLSPLVTQEIKLIGSSTGSLREAVDLLARDAIDVLPLITRRVRANEGARILDFAARPESLVVLVEV